MGTHKKYRKHKNAEKVQKKKESYGSRNEEGRDGQGDKNAVHE